MKTGPAINVNLRLKAATMETHIFQGWQHNDGASIRYDLNFDISIYHDHYMFLRSFYFHVSRLDMQRILDIDVNDVAGLNIHHKMFKRDTPTVTAWIM